MKVVASKRLVVAGAAEQLVGAEVAEQYTGDILKHRFSELEATAGADIELEALKRAAAEVAIGTATTSSYAAASMGDSPGKCPP